MPPTSPRTTHWSAPSSGTEQLGRCQLPLQDVLATESGDLLAEAEAAELALPKDRIYRRQAGEQDLRVVDLKGLVEAVGKLALKCQAAGAQRRVEAGADQVDVFRILDEITCALGVVAGQEASERTGTSADERQPTVMSNVVKTEFGVVELFGEIAQREAELAGILGLVVGAARDRGADAAGQSRAAAADRR